MSEYNFSYDDLDSMINEAASGIDFSDYFSGSGQNFDFGSLDPNAFSFDNIDSMINDAALGLGDFNFDTSGINIGLRSLSPPNVDAGNVAAEDALNLDEFIKGFSDVKVDGIEEVPFGESASQYKQPSAEERAAELERYQRYIRGEDAGLELGAGEGVQNFGSSVDMDKSLSDMGDRGTKLTSDWQKMKDGRYVKIFDDGTGIGIDEDGNYFALSTSQVGDRIKSDDLNTFASGYNTATGGNKIAPGGGSSVVLKNGKEGQLLTDGTVINKDTGTVIGKKEDVNTVITQDGDGNVITKKIEDVVTDKDKDKDKDNKEQQETKKNDLSYLLPLLLAVLAMNRGGGGGGSSGAVIPSLSADRRQLPYGPISGSTARPGAGGVTYFSPTTYTQKAAGGGLMYGGGGLSSLGGYSDGGRLLKGPGDGVSDSIPATIGGKQPARLATGEFVIPARIVSELGNGSTEAGAKKLYAMMRRVQNARRKTKNVAADTKAHKYLPA